MRGADGTGDRPKIPDAEPDRTMRSGSLARLPFQLFIAAALPAWLGMLGAPIWLFIAYAVLAGGVLTATESLRNARDVFSEPAMYHYTLVRVALVAGGGIIPFVLGAALNR